MQPRPLLDSSERSRLRRLESDPRGSAPRGHALEARCLRRTEMVVDTDSRNIIGSAPAEAARASKAGERGVVSSEVRRASAVTCKTHVIVFDLHAPVLIDHALDAGANEPTRSPFVARVGGGGSTGAGSRGISAHFADRKTASEIP